MENVCGSKYKVPKNRQDDPKMSNKFAALKVLDIKRNKLVENKIVWNHAKKTRAQQPSAVGHKQVVGMVAKL